MVYRHWEIRKPTPLVSCGIVDLDHFGRCAARDHAADRDNLGPEGYRRVFAEGACWDRGQDSPGLSEGGGQGRNPGEEEGNENHFRGDLNQIGGRSGKASQETEVIPLALSKIEKIPVAS